jgi:hypothetical protein
MDITSTFGVELFAASFTGIWDLAQAQADANGAPVAVWGRDGWLTICEDPEPDPDPEVFGWRMVALIDPTEVE